MLVVTRQSMDHIVRRMLPKASSSISKATLRSFQTTSAKTKVNFTQKGTAFPFLLVLGTSCGLVAAVSSADYDYDDIRNLLVSSHNINTVKCSDVLMLQTHKEPATGILFPGLCNGLTFVGCGVRVKYGFVKVYAVGTYVDPIAMSAVKSQGEKAIEEALLKPEYPKTIRIVMNRDLSIEKYTDAIVEALGPRMNGEDMDKLEEFKKLNPPVDLVKGAEIEMTVRGDVMLYKNAVGGVGQIQSATFCRALCDVYYGKDPVSPTQKADCIKGIQNL